jgi:hypothetical protein
MCRLAPRGGGWGGGVGVAIALTFLSRCCRTIFYYLFNFSITNAFILYREYRRKQQVDGKPKVPNVTSFRLRLITDLLRQAAKLEEKAKADAQEAATAAAAAAAAAAEAAAAEAAAALAELGAPVPAPVLQAVPVPVPVPAPAPAGAPGPALGADVFVLSSEDEEKEEDSDSDCVTESSEDSSSSGLEDFVVETPPRLAAAATRRTAPPRSTVKGAHKLETVKSTRQHRCVFCGNAHAFVVCVTCTPPVYLCLSGSRNCYNAYHKL